MLPILLACGLTGSAFGQLGTGWIETTYTKKIHLDDDAGLQIFNWTSYKSVCSSPICADYSYDSGTDTETFQIFDSRSNRSEIRLQNEYFSGARQFEGYVTFYSPLHDESLFQIFGSTSGATLCMMRGYSDNGGKLRVVGGIGDLVTGVYGIEKRINVIHIQDSAGSGTVQFYVDGVLEGEFNESEAVDTYWKYGCYGTTNGNVPAIAEWRSVRTFRDGTPPGEGIPTPPGAYEAEDATLFGAIAASGNEGFTGSGFVDYLNPSNDYIEWTVDADDAGLYDLSFRYALGSGNRPLEIRVNGQVIDSSLSFPATGDWVTWDYTSIVSASLQSGNNTVRATATGSSGANVDHLLVEFVSGGTGNWISEDIGSVGQTGSATLDQQTGEFTVNGSGADIWGSADAFHFVDQVLSGDGQIVARVTSVENTNAWAKAGVMIRETANANSKHAMVVVTPSNGIAFQRRTATGGGSSNTGNSGLSAPYWVKVVRIGSTFTGYRSANGQNWVLVGSDTISMANDVLCGLAVTAHDNSTLNTSTFDNVTVGPPDPVWMSGDVGSVGVAGNATIDTQTGEFTINGSGADIWSTADAFHFVDQPLSGDGEISARVVSVENTHDFAKAAVMIRDTLDADSANAIMYVRPGGDVRFQWRATAGGVSDRIIGSSSTAPRWLRVARNGSTFTGYESANGTSWTEVGAITISMGADVHVGLAVTAHDNSTLNTSVFDNVVVSP